MNSIGSLLSMIGEEKTLIIACGEYGITKAVEFNDSIYIYFLQDNILQRHDPLEKGRIQHYIESKHCTQIIFLGIIEKHLITSLHKDDVHHNLRSILKFNLSVFLRDQSKAILSPALHNQLLTEQHVIMQCNQLLSYYFIKERVDKRELHVTGLVTERDADQFTKIYCNGIMFNDIISMN